MSCAQCAFPAPRDFLTRKSRVRLGGSSRLAERPGPPLPGLDQLCWTSCLLIKQMDALIRCATLAACGHQQLRQRATDASFRLRRHT